MPILESHGVDLVLAGHSHIYERSMLLNRAYVTRWGIRIGEVTIAFRK